MGPAVYVEWAGTLDETINLKALSRGCDFFADQHVLAASHKQANCHDMTISLYTSNELKEKI